MPITEAQREERRKFLGSSDAPAIIGVNPWKNAADVFWEKIRTPSESQHPPEDDAIIVGNFCEDAVLNWFEKETGYITRRNQTRLHQNQIMAANLDAVVEERKEIVEVKTSGIITPFNRDEWGEVGTDELPERVIIQTQHQMAVAGPEYRLAWVPVLLGGIGFRLYKVDRNDELIAALEQVEIRFWNEYVLTKTPPPDQIPTLSTLKKVQRQAFKTAHINGDLVIAWTLAKADYARAAKAKEQAERAILNALGDAEEGISPAGHVTYLEQTRKEYVVKAGTFRVLRKKGELCLPQPSSL